MHAWNYGLGLLVRIMCPYNVTNCGILLINISSFSQRILAESLAGLELTANAKFQIESKAKIYSFWLYKQVASKHLCVNCRVWHMSGNLAVGRSYKHVEIRYAKCQCYSVLPCALVRSLWFIFNSWMNDSYSDAWYVWNSKVKMMKYFHTTNEDLKDNLQSYTTYFSLVLSGITGKQLKIRDFSAILRQHMVV